MYDILIIGGGIIGCSIARALAKYDAKTVVVEKNNDVCEETSMANSAIVHSGYDPLPGSLKAKLNVRGNEMFTQLAKELDFEFGRIGSITLATEEQVPVLKELVERAKQNNVPVEILEKDKLHEMEPFLNDDIVAGLLAPTCGIVNPFEYCVALMENAMDNGVELKLNTEVKDIKKVNDHYEVVTNNGTIETKIVINAAGIHSGDVAHMIGNMAIQITPYKGEYFVLDHFTQPFVNHTLFPLPSKKGKGILVSPTTHRNYIIGPNSNETVPEDYATEQKGLDEIRAGAQTLVHDIPFQEIIRNFAGLRAKDISGDFVIKEDENNANFFHVAGIQSPGIASSPAIAEYVEELVLKNNKFATKAFNPVRRPLVKLSKLSDEARNALIKQDPRFGKIICRCEKVSEGEIVDVIHRNCGATTIKGVKKRIRPGFGKCQGGFCEPLVLKILARELNVSPLDIKYGSKKADILLSESKEVK